MDPQTQDRLIQRARGKRSKSTARPETLKCVCHPTKARSREKRNQKRSSQARIILSVILGIMSFGAEVVQPNFGRALPQTNQQVTKDVGILQPRVPIEETLGGTDRHIYRLHLEPNQYLRVAVEQKGVDIAMVLFGPDGKKLGEVSLPRTLQGRKVITTVTEQSGEHRVEVESYHKDAAPGKYQITLTDLRDANPQDKPRLELRKTVDDANNLRLQGTAESLNTAIKKVEEALPRIREIGDRWGEANALTVLGACYFVLSEYQKTIEVISPAVQLWEGLPDGLLGQGVVLGYVGSAHNALGDWDRVIETYQKVLAVHKQLGSAPGEAIALQNLAAFYLRVGNTEKAFEYANLALEVIPRTRDRLREANALNTIGSIYRTAGNLNKAVEAYDRALALRPLGDHRTEGTLLCNRGTVSFEMGQTEAALDYLNTSVEIVRAAGERRVEGIALRGIGEIYSALGEPAKALDNFNLSLGITRSIGDLAEQAKSLYSIARVKRDLNQAREARRDIESAIEIVESLRLRIVDQQLRSFYSPIVTGYYDLYIDILMRQPNEDPIVLSSAAIEASERGRARSLLELLNESRIEIRRGVDESLLKQERSVQQALNTAAEEQIRLVNGKHTTNQAERIAGQIKSLTSRLEEIRAQIRSSNPRYAMLTQPQPLSLKKIQMEVLDADTLLLEYALGDKRSYLFAVTQGSITGHELPARAVIEAAARRFYDSVKDKTKEDELAKTAERLSQMLLAPVFEQLGTRRLAIVADGGLHYLPFAALPVPATRASTDKSGGPSGSGKLKGSLSRRPLVVDHEIVSLPSASALALVRRETKGREPASKLVAVLADPVFDETDVRVRRTAVNPGESREHSTAGLNTGLKGSVEETGLAGGDWPLPRLLGTRREAKTILSLAPTQTSKQAIDFDASRETAIGDDLSQYQIVHFATHGLINNRHPELSGLVLSLVDQQGRPNNGFLRLNEIYNLRLPAELVVLSACQTGLGKEIRGEGLVGLTRGFMYAGARRLMASLWQVDDAATSELMQRFYRGVLGEKALSPAAALRAAQIELWNQKQWRSPYYWAAFVVQGEWN